MIKMSTRPTQIAALRVLLLHLSVRPSQTRKTKRRTETKINVNVSEGMSNCNRCANLPARRSKIKVTGRQNIPRMASYVTSQPGTRAWRSA